MNPVTAGAVLFGADDRGAAVTHSPGWRRVLGSLDGAIGSISAGGRSLVVGELSAAVASLLSLDLGQLLVAAWRRHATLTAAARATQNDPVASEVVELAAHQVTSAHRPYVEVMVNGVHVATVHFELTIVIDVGIVDATVRQARLVELHTGRIKVRISLAAEGVELAARDAEIDAPVNVGLGAGIPLLGTE